MKPSSSQPLKILIVDNDSRWRHFVRSLFTSDVLITECADGASAFLTYGRLLPDWVIMDIAMEPMDGLYAAKKIKEAFPPARIIFLTQFSEPEFRMEAALLGATGYVLKDDVDRVQELIFGGGTHDERPPTLLPVYCWFGFGRHSGSAQNFA